MLACDWLSLLSDPGVALTSLPRDPGLSGLRPAPCHDVTMTHEAGHWSHPHRFRKTEIASDAMLVITGAKTKKLKVLMAILIALVILYDVFVVCRQ